MNPGKHAVFIHRSVDMLEYSHWFSDNKLQERRDRMEDCPFCHPEFDNAQAIVLSNEHCLFLQKPQEVLVGSGLIVPRAHRDNVFELTSEEWAATNELLQQVKTRLDAEFHPQGYNVGWNCGEAGGQTIFHAHLHVIPRFADEPHAGKGIRWWLKQKENKRDGHL
jgi:diadenosine tetraphosphate (Ap4A) HIT family hydrolase